MNGTHTIARRMSDKNRNMMHNPQVGTYLATLESLTGHKGYDHGTLCSFLKTYFNTLIIINLIVNFY